MNNSETAKFIQISKEIGAFLLNPSLHFSFKRFNKLDILSFVFAATMVFSMLGGLLSDTLSSFLGFSETIDKNRMEKYSILELILYGSVAIPILEEFAFRLYLYPKKLGIVISITIFAYLFSSRIIFEVESINIKEFLLERLAITAITAMLCYLLLLFVSDNILYKFFKERFRLIFYFSVLLFGCVHISNFAPFGILTLLLAPIFTLRL